jgi:hypothetical protein
MCKPNAVPSLSAELWGILANDIHGTNDVLWKVGEQWEMLFEPTKKLLSSFLTKGENHKHLCLIYYKHTQMN